LEAGEGGDVGDVGEVGEVGEVDSVGLRGEGMMITDSEMSFLKSALILVGEECIYNSL
jgi:hypothetical protein